MIWVVGGTSGIGYAVVNRLLEEGEDVEATGEEFDVRSQDSLNKFVQMVRLREMEVGEVVYCAGVNHLDWSEDIDLDAAADLYNVNVLGLLRVLRAADKARKVVVVGSDAAWRPMRTSVAYCASKAALHMAAQVIARERSHDPDFRLHIVAPGKVEGTQMTNYVDRRSAELRPDMDHIKYQRSQIPDGKFLRREQVAEVVAHLTRHDFDGISGSILPVNGGRA